MHKPFLSLLGLISLLATTNADAANAPSSLAGKKLTLNVTEHGDGDTFVAIFYVTSANYYWEVYEGGNDWDSGNYEWSKSGSSGTFSWGQVSYGRMDISMNFNNYTFTATEREGSQSQAAASGTFSVSDYSEDEIPFNRFFSDDFSDIGKSDDNWPFATNYGITESLKDGSYTLSGTLNDEDEKWPEVGANSLLSLGEEWVVEGSAFTNSGEIIELSIESDVEARFQLEVHVGISGNGVVSSIQYERDDVADYQEQYFNNYDHTGNNNGTFRIRNSASEKTFHIEWLDGAEWKNLNSLNWETGTLSKSANSNGSSSTQLNDWETMESFYFNPQMEFSVPDSLTINKGDYGFTSFSVIESAPVSAPSSLVGKKIRISFVETANDAEGVHEFYFAGNGKGWMRYWLESNDPSDETYWDDDNFTYQISGENSALLKLGTNEDYSEIPLTFTSENAGSFTAQGWKIENGSLVQTGPMNATGSFILSEYDESELPASQGWLWFDQYPWVYSDEEKNWLYFLPSNGKINVYSVRDKAWREMTKTE